MIALLGACQSNSGKTEQVSTDSLVVDSLNKEVMDIHDEGMAKMMAIRRLKGRVQEVADSLDKIKSPAVADFKSTGLILDSANNAMNTWMHAYDMQMEGKTLEEKKAYLEAEKKKIVVVRDLMLQSIQQAKTLLKEE